MTTKCIKCGQGSLIEQPDGYVCSSCVATTYPKLTPALYEHCYDEKLALEFTVNWEQVIIPLEENLGNGYSTHKTFEEWQQAVNELIDRTKEIAGGSLTESDHKLKFIELTNYETERCDESDLMIYSELAYKPSNWYSRPYDTTPTSFSFLSVDMADAKAGEHYSKDFNWYYCESCGRTICEQNPSDGYHVQGGHDEEGNFECNKCKEERMLNEGSDLNKELGEVSKYTTQSECEEAGWTYAESFTVGNGRFSSGISPQKVNKYLKDKYPNSKVLIVLDELSIIGDGAECSIYIKNN